MTKKIAKNIFATRAESDARSVNPNIAEISATTRKIRDQYNTACLLCIVQKSYMTLAAPNTRRMRLKDGRRVNPVRF